MVRVTSTAAEVVHGHAKKPGSKTDKAPGALIKRYTFAKYGRKGAIKRAQAQHYAIVKSEERRGDHDEGAPVSAGTVSTPVALGSQRRSYAEELPWKTFFDSLWDGTNIYLVDGAYVRNNLDSDFTEGGHSWVYDYVGTKRDPEIWVEFIGSEDANDIQNNMVHECYELVLMRYMNQGYEQAHDNTVRLEAALRRFDKGNSSSESMDTDFFEQGAFAESDKSEDDIDADELRMGTVIEHEHTEDENVARKIALDHLAEIPDYYTRLVAMEHEAEHQDFGGEGSGNFDHSGRPGEIGGSSKEGSSADGGNKPTHQQRSMVQQHEDYLKAIVDKQMEMYKPEQRTTEARAAVEKFVKAKEDLKKEWGPLPEPLLQQAAKDRVNKEIKETPKAEVIKAEVPKTPKSETKSATKELFDVRAKYTDTTPQVNKALRDLKTKNLSPEEYAKQYHAIRDKYRQDREELKKQEKEIKKTATAEMQKASDVQGTKGEKDPKTLEKEYKATLEDVEKTKQEWNKIEEARYKESGIDDKIDEGSFEKNWEKVSDYRDKLSKDQQKFYEDRHVTQEPHERAQFHIDQANALPIDEIRGGLRVRYGDKLDPLNETSARQVYASVTHNEEVLGKDKFSSIIKGFDIKEMRSAAATYNYNNGIININQQIADKAASIKDWEGKDDKGILFHPVGTGKDVMKSIIDHEIGHGVHNNMAGGERKISLVTGKLGRDGVERLVSKYATKNTAELAAECWSSHMNNGKPNAVIEYVSGLMRG